VWRWGAIRSRALSARRSDDDGVSLRGGLLEGVTGDDRMDILAEACSERPMTAEENEQIFAFLNKTLPRREAIATHANRKDTYCWCVPVGSAPGTICGFLIGIGVFVFPLLANIASALDAVGTTAYWDSCAPLTWSSTSDDASGPSPDITAYGVCYDDCLAAAGGTEVRVTPYFVEHPYMTTSFLAAVEFIAIFLAYYAVDGVRKGSMMTRTMMVRGIITTPSETCCGCVGLIAFSWRNCRSLSIIFAFLLAASMMVAFFTEATGVVNVAENPDLAQSSCNFTMSYIAPRHQLSLQTLCGEPLPDGIEITQMAFCFYETNPTRPASPETWITYFYRVMWLLVPLLPFFWNTYSIAQSPYSLFSADVLTDPAVHEELGSGAWYRVSVDARDKVLQSIDRVDQKSDCFSRTWRRCVYCIGGYVAPDTFFNFLPAFIVSRKGLLDPISSRRNS
jgi:hypothetical protein